MGRTGLGHAESSVHGRAGFPLHQQQPEVGSGLLCACKAATSRQGGALGRGPFAYARNALQQVLLVTQAMIVVNITAWD